MKPPWQQQQQRRWQQQRLEMGYVWDQKQKAKKKARAEQAQAGDRFSQVEAEVARLCQELAAGHLTEKQFKERLGELMVQDAQGNWWMIRVDTGQWYRYDGVDWVPGAPPRLATPARPQPMWVWNLIWIIGIALLIAWILSR